MTFLPLYLWFLCIFTTTIAGFGLMITLGINIRDYIQSKQPIISIPAVHNTNVSTKIPTIPTISDNKTSAQSISTSTTSTRRSSSIMITSILCCMCSIYMKWHIKDIHTLYSLYLQTGGSYLYFILYVALLTQPMIMLSCEFAPHTMDTLMSNSHTSSFSSNIGAAQINYQILCFLAYHTSTMSRLLHVVSLCVDAAAYLTITHAIIEHYITSSIVTYLIWGMIISLLAGQAYSYAGYKLVAGVMIAWCFVYVLSSTLMSVLMLIFDTTFIINTSSAVDIRAWVAFRLAAVWLLLSCGIRVLGHSTDIGRSAVIGSQSFLFLRSHHMHVRSCHHVEQSIPCPSRLSCFYQHVTQCALLLFRKWVRVCGITLFGLGAEFNAGMPFRLFPVFIHFIMLRYNMYGHTTSSTTEISISTTTPNIHRSTPSPPESNADTNAEANSAASDSTSCSPSVGFSSTSKVVSHSACSASMPLCVLMYDRDTGVVSYSMDDMMVIIEGEVMSLHEANVWAQVAVTYGWKGLAASVSWVLSSLAKLSVSPSPSPSPSPSHGMMRYEISPSPSRISSSRAMCGLFIHSSADFAMDHLWPFYTQEEKTLLSFHSHDADLCGLWPHLPCQVLECHGSGTVSGSRSRSRSPNSERSHESPRDCVSSCSSRSTDSPSDESDSWCWRVTSTT